MIRSLQSWRGIEILDVHVEMGSSCALVDVSHFVVLRGYASFYRLGH